MDKFLENTHQFQELSDKAIDWHIKSWKFKTNSPEWKICMLKRLIYMRDALKHLRKAKECLLTN